jgi:thiol-disulfide isomerase/thioredoxin
MRLLSRRANFRFALPASMVSLTAALLGPLLLSALPVKGTPAPPLDSVQLVQAPPATHAGWASLNGKIVVLEFWATWCAPCIESIPHLNQLVASLDPARFQFISIDDEDPKLVLAFLAKKHMAGWVGTDTTGSLFARYGVKSRPTTIVVDANGRIVAATVLDSLNVADLQAVAAGRSVKFKPAMEITSSSTETVADAASRPLFAVSLSNAAPDEKFSTVRHPSTGTDIIGADAEYLLTDAYSPTTNRLVLACTLPGGRYDLRTEFAGVPDSVTSSVIREAILSGLHLEVQPKTVTKSAYILRATNASKKLLSPSVSTGRQVKGYFNGSLRVMNGTMDDLAYELATGLENPVINDTGLDGHFDVQLKFTERDIGSINAALKNVLGLELIQGNQESSITVLEVNKQEETNPANTTNRQSPNH